MTDDHLRELFQATRRRDAERAPSFAGTLAAARRAPATRSGRGRVVVALAAAAALVLIAVLWRRPSRDQWMVPLSSAHWEAPTDFLLETPGAELLRTVPPVGVIDQERKLR